MSDLLTPLTEDCPSLLFAGRFADLVALNQGDGAVVRPCIAETTSQLLLTAPPPANEVALVVGGNGFVGAHLVARLSREPGVRRVWATVRATPQCTSEQRFEQTLAKYRISDLDRRKIELVDANPTRTRLGLTDGRYRDLAQDVDMVFNCASSTDYSSSYLQLREDWVMSMLRILQLSTEGKRKHTTYVGSVSSYFFQSPADFCRPYSWWYSGYAQMKWVNGQVVGFLADEGMLPVTLCESPYVLGSTTEGLDPGMHYSWWRIIAVARSIGMIWEGPGMNYVPVDVLVDALTRNAVLEHPLPRLLPRNVETYNNDLLAELLDLEIVPWERFLAEVTARASRQGLNTDLSFNLNELVQIVNQPPAVMPAGTSPPAYDNRGLYELYLSNLRFPDRRKAR